jgi:excinuclease ABC subunit A
LRLLPFAEGPTPVHSDAPRPTVANGLGPSQEVIITAHAAEDLQTPGFETFLARAVASYRRAEDGAEDFRARAPATRRRPR